MDCIDSDDDQDEDSSVKWEIDGVSVLFAPERHYISACQQAIRHLYNVAKQKDGWEFVQKTETFGDAFGLVWIEYEQIESRSF